MSSDLDYDMTEEGVRKGLSVMLGIELRKREEEVAPNTIHEFDAISDDCKIVAEIKCSQVPKRGKLRHTQLAEMMEACIFMLTIRRAEQRILAISDPGFHKLFTRSMQAKAAVELGIAIKLVKV